MKNTQLMGARLLDHPHGRVFVAGLITVLIALVARSNFILNPGWSVDSYSNWTSWPGIDLFLRQGRIGQYLLIQAFEALGFDRNSSAGILQGAGVVLFALSAPFMFVTFSRKEKPSIFPLVIAGSLFVLHPFQAEILTFPEASFFPAFACALGIASVVLVATYNWLWWLGSIVLLAALSIYQIALNYACVMVIFGLFLTWLEVGCKAENFYQKNILRPFIFSTLTISVGLALYLLSNKLITYFIKADQEGRAQIIEISDIGTRIDQITSLTQEILRNPFIINLPVVSFLLWAVVASGWIVACIEIIRTRKNHMIIPLSLILIMPIAAMGVVLVGSTWWPVPRVLGGVVLLMSFGIYLALTRKAPPIFRIGSATLAILAILVSTSISYRIHADQHQVNYHDRNLSRLIYHRFIDNKEFDESLPIVIVNRHMRWTHPIGVKTVKGDMNISALSVPWSIQGLFSISTGRNLKLIGPNEQDEEICRKLPRWPSPEATVVLSDKAIACI